MEESSDTYSFILNHPVSRASELIYTTASALEESLQLIMDRNDYFENTEGLNQAGFKLLFVNQAKAAEVKPIHVKTSHPYDHRSDAVFVYHDKSRASPYLLIVIEFEYIPLESINEEARQTQSTQSKQNMLADDKAKISTLSTDEIKDFRVRQPNPLNPHRDDEGQTHAALSDRVVHEARSVEEVVNKNKLLLEDFANNIRQYGYTFHCPMQEKEITLHSAICAVVCGVGDRIMYEVYDPIVEQHNKNDNPTEKEKKQE
jgi:hypothetical protein